MSSKVSGFAASDTEADFSTGRCSTSRGTFGRCAAGLVVVGVWHDSANVAHGFQWDAGTYTSIDVPGGTNTYAFGITSQNTIAGYYTDSAGSDHGFLLSNRSYMTTDMPGVRSTFVFGINNSGMLVGQYIQNGKVHGFLATRGRSKSSIHNDRW